MMKITKGVIPCGGLGTRLMPLTKAMAKEMIPIVDRPCIDYIVDEMVESGITDVLFVVNPGKSSIREYFTENALLYERLEGSGQREVLEVLRRIDGKARYHFVTQEQPKGSGAAVALAEEFVAGEAFVLAWGDDLMVGDGEPVTLQLLRAYESYSKTVLGVQERGVPEIFSYGVIDIESKVGDDLFKVKGIQEKPRCECELKSKLGTLGRYIVTPTAFDALREITPASNGELQFTDAINLLAEKEGVYALNFKGKRYDMGNKAGCIKAAIDLALSNEEIGEEIKKYILDIERGNLFPLSETP